MTGDVTVPPASSSQTKSESRESKRLYYLDWLRVILLLGIFLYHAVHPFDPIDWHIKNVDQSFTVMVIFFFAFPWGLPLFFLIAGAGSMFSLRRRSNRQYIRERVNRLLIPFVVGSILLSPFQKYLEALHKETFQGSFLSFIPEMLAESISGNLFSPHIFGRWGLHLWFLGFLFAYSLLALPIFNWFKRDSGRSFVSWLGRVVEKRGGILLFILPLALARVLIQPFFPEEHGWLGFAYSFLIFISGYIIFSDERFLGIVQRDRWLLFAGGMMSLVAFSVMFAATDGSALAWFDTFVVPWSILFNFVFAIFSWCWALYVLYLAMTHLNFSNKWLDYGNGTIMPFYLIHQPVIILIAFFVVQWDAGILVKLLIVVIGSFLITIGLVELLIRPFKPMRKLFGMKSRRLGVEDAKSALPRG